MKHLSASFTKLVAVVGCAFTLGSCARSEYTMLPKTSSYHGESRVATAAPAAKVASTPEAATAVVVAPAPPVNAPEVVTEQNAPASTAAVVPAAPKATTDVALAAPATSADVAATTISTPTAAPKMTRVQRFAATKLVKKIGKMSGIPQVKQQLAAAESQKIGGNLRTGVILLLIGLLISLFSGINRIFGLIGAVIAVIGLIFIILYLLDSL